MAAQARVLSGDKLEQLVVRLQRHSGRSKETCWRFIIQHGIKRSVDHRRWTESELETVAGARWTTGCGSYVLARTNRELEPIKPMERCAVNETVSRDSRLPLPSERLEDVIGLQVA